MGTTVSAPLRRSMADRWLGGVCAGIAHRLGVDPVWIRIAAIVLATFGGLAIPLYVVAWALLPPDDESAERRLRRTGRGTIEVALGAGLLVLAALLALRATGLWVSDALTWPLVLLAAGGALLWRTSLARSPEAEAEAADAAKPRARPQLPERAAEQQRAQAGWAARMVSRTGVGVALVFAAAFAFIRGTGVIAHAGDVLITLLVALVALGIVLAPWIARLVRSLDAERAERIRSQERAEVAAHLHDSVLQTLALVQKRADDPAQVAALARRQERELRAWLSGRRQAADGPRTLRAALEATAGEIEQAHGAEVEVVGVGDVELDQRGEALVAAAREAILNAARHGGGRVSVYAEASGGDEIVVFVRDRGPGFDPAAVPADRRGIAESIVGRMARHGGRATVVSRPGEGTEVELALPTRAEAPKAWTGAR